MTDKTIINGVDVSGCEFVGKYKICKAYCNTSIGKPCGCEHNIDCHYKQSAHKDERIRELEQEKIEKRKQCDACLKEWTCEAYNFLKRQNSGYRTSTENQRKLIKELKQQNAKLVEALERIITHEEINPTTTDELSVLTVEEFFFRYQIIKAVESIALKNIAQQALEEYFNKDDVT